MPAGHDSDPEIEVLDEGWEEDPAPAPTANPPSAPASAPRRAAMPTVPDHDPLRHDLPVDSDMGRPTLPVVNPEKFDKPEKG